jgi:hypothetical protein
MARSTRWRLGAITAAGALLTLGAPALAVTPTCTTTTVTACVAGVPVTLTGLGGTRQFAVETLAGTELTGLNLGTGGSQPFRTHVTDTTFANLSQGYTVSATMSNLYLNNGTGHDWAVKVPSSDVSLAYATNPLSALGLSVTDLPKLSLTGTLASCANLPSTVQTVLGLSSLGVPLASLTDLVAVTNLCTALGAGVPVTSTIDGIARTVSPTLTSLLDLPTALTGAEAGAFTSPAFAGTVGAADPAASGAAAATPRRIMTGTPGLTAGLTTALTSALNSALTGVPLTSVNDAGARTTLTAAVSTLQTGALSTLGNAIAVLSAAKQVALLNTLTSTLVTPVLGDIQTVDGQYFGFPILHATPSTPVPGTYDGTLTVTFVQG